MRAWLRHMLRAGNRHAVHSPFVYTLVTEVLRPRTPPFEPRHLEQLRRELLRDGRRLHVTDLGAGPRGGSSPVRRVSFIARTSLQTPRRAAQMARLAAWLKPRNILELGTSLGVTTLYLAQAAPHAEVITLEGCPETAAVAKENFRRMRSHNIRLLTGPFQDRLPEALSGMPAVDLAYIDGNHAYGPTMEYFGQCMAKAQAGSVLLLDDIHWSAGMGRAWEAIKADLRVTVTVDLYRMGLVFLHHGQQREHFRLRY